MTETRVRVSRRKPRRNQKVQLMLDVLKRQPADSRSISVDELLQQVEQRGASIPRKDAAGFLKSLAEQNLGVFTLGRRGRSSRFEATDSLNRAAQPAAQASERVMAKASAAPQPGMLTHTYILRLGMELRFELPSDLSTSEAVRLSEFIKTLPFG